MLSHTNKAIPLHWREVREDFITLNPKLATIIDRIDPDEEYTFFKIRYPFGAKVYDKGILQLPSIDGNLLPIHNHTVDSILRENLTYQFIPLSIVTHGVTEVFIQSIERIRPLWIYKPGDLLGLFEWFDKPHLDSSAPVTNVTAGARTLFLAPSITDTVSHTRLCREFNIQSKKPTNLLEHWHIFKEIAKHEDDEDKWYFEMIFFAKTWREKPINTPAWIDLIDYIATNAWRHSQYRRSQVTFCEVWEEFGKNLVKKRSVMEQLPRQYIIDTIRYLRFIARGDICGFRALEKDDEQFGPIKFLRRAYKDVYNLNTYASIFMAPDEAENTPETSVLYYSHQLPTLIDSPFEIYKRKPSVAQDLLATVEAMNIFQTTIKNSNEKIYETIDDENTYEYFHNEVDKSGILKPTKIIPEGDEIISKQVSNAQGKLFPNASKFFRGCIRIKTKV